MVVERATRLAADAQRQGAAPGRCTAEAEELGSKVQSSLSTRGVVAFRIIDRDGARAGVQGSRALRTAPALGRVSAAARPRARRRAAVRAPLSGDRAFGQGRVGSAPPGRVVPGADPRRRRAAGRGARHGRGSRPRARDDLLRRAPREHRRGVRVLGRRPHAHAVALRRRADRRGSAERGGGRELRVPDPGARPGRQPGGGTRAGARAGRASAHAAGGAGGRGARQDVRVRTARRHRDAVPRLSRQRRHRRVALASRLRHGRHRRNLDGRGVCGAALSSGSASP